MKKATKPAAPKTQTAKRVGAIMHRKSSTRWQVKEINAYLILLPIEESDLASMERYYRMNWPPRHGKNILRTDLYTLLNWWSGELDRANVWNEAHPDKPKPRKIIPLPPAPSLPLEPLSEEDQAVHDRFMQRRQERKKQPGDEISRKIKNVMES